MKPLPEINAIPLFKDVQEELIALLKDLSDQEWQSKTWSSRWNVKDVVAHLLDGDIRRLSLHRDHHTLPDPENPITDYNSLLNFLNTLNEKWVTAAKRISPRLLIELTEFLTPKVVTHLNELDPKGKALFPVDWAGEKESQNWFDIAREYTEKWHHQQQIREAVGRPLLTGQQWLHPLFETLIRAVPVVYNKHATDVEPTDISIQISGEVNDSWHLTNRSGSWELFKSDGDSAETKISMDDDTAWRIFTKNISEEEAIDRIQISGDQKKGQLVAKSVSYMK